MLKQSGSGTFPWCVRKDVSVADGYVEVKFKPLEGREDQAGGLVWRWKDGDDYYIARANALEGNVSLYHTEKAVGASYNQISRRAGCGKAVAHVARGISGPHIKVLLDGKPNLEA